MSIRTIIEINHDYVGGKGDVVAALELLVRRLAHDSLKDLQVDFKHNFSGVRVLAQRHHADKITLVIE